MSAAQATGAPSSSPPARELRIESGGGHRAGRILLFVLLLGSGIRFGVVHPGRNYLLDFRAYYAAGQAILRGINPYDIATIQRQVHLPGKQPVFYCPYPPPALALMVPFAAVPYPLAQIPWCLFQFGLSVVALLLLLRALDVEVGAPVSVLIAVPFVLSCTFFQLFRWGQFDMVVLALLSGALLSMRRGRSTAAGIWIGLAALAKVTPCLYLAIFLLRRDWRALRAGLLTIVLALGASAPLVGLDGLRAWLAILTEKLGQVQHIISPENMSLHGFVYRAFIEHDSFLGPSVPWWNLGEVAAVRVTQLLLAAIVLITGAWMLWFGRRLRSPECMAAVVPVVLMMSPITWTHHCVILLIPLAVISVAVVRAPRVRAIDVAWLVLILLNLTMWPVQRFELDIPSVLEHLLAPTATYAVLLTWLFMIARYVPLHHRAAESTPVFPAPDAQAPNHVAAGRLAFEST